MHIADVNTGNLGANRIVGGGIPIGVGAALYLNEYAKQGRLLQILRYSSETLAAIPSIIFGLLGLAVFLNVFGLPRSAPLVGGLVLALMTLPTIIIATRASLKSVPPSIREAALGIGASKMQMVTHHVLPLALPGILTGTIIGMARALGESAPLLMIGMVAFIVDIPGGLTDSATVLPVQIFLWADSPERAFVERTSAATIVLLAFLIVMNATAVILRGLEVAHALQFERGRASLRLSVGSSSEHAEALQQTQARTDALLRQDLQDVADEELPEVQALAAELRRIPVWLDLDRRVLEKRADRLTTRPGSDGWLARLSLVEKFNPRVDVLVGATMRALAEILEERQSHGANTNANEHWQLTDLLFKWCEAKEAVGR